MNRPVHFEIHASDPPGLIDFYEKLFGWAAVPMVEGVVWALRTGEGPRGLDGAIVHRKGARATIGQPINSFCCTVEVADLDAKLERGLALGAQLAMAKFGIPGMGWTAYLIDPDGNVFGLHQPGSGAA